MEKRVIGIAGMPGAGKDTVARMIAELIPEPVCTFSFSRVIREKLLEPKGINPTRENLQQAGHEIDPLALQELVAEYIEERPEAFVILTGIRRQPDLDLVRRFPRHLFVAVTAAPAICFSRIKARNEKPGESETTWEQFLVQLQAPTETGIPALIAEADLLIENGGTLDELSQALKKAASRFTSL